jgi:hypothetical protein
MTFMERVAPVVDETINALAKTKFVQDPVAGLKYSRATSIISSAYKRHGRILETALRESLRESNRHRVWQEDAFRVSRAADALVGSQSEDAPDHLLLRRALSTPSVVSGQRRIGRAFRVSCRWNDRAGQ